MRNLQSVINTVSGIRIRAILLQEGGLTDRWLTCRIGPHLRFTISIQKFSILILHRKQSLNRPWQIRHSFPVLDDDTTDCPLWLPFPRAQTAQTADRVGKFFDSFRLDDPSILIVASFFFRCTICLMCYRIVEEPKLPIEWESSSIRLGSWWPVNSHRWKLLLPMYCGPNALSDTPKNTQTGRFFSSC
jgi:hypothetical protein